MSHSRSTYRHVRRHRSGSHEHTHTDELIVIARHGHGFSYTTTHSDTHTWTSSAASPREHCIERTERSRRSQTAWAEAENPVMGKTSRWERTVPAAGQRGAHVPRGQRVAGEVFQCGGSYRRESDNGPRHPAPSAPTRDTLHHNPSNTTGLDKPSSLSWQHLLSAHYS